MARQNFTNLTEMRTRLSEEFDHMRTPQPNQIEQDERLATFITITERPDHHSLWKFLLQHNWDLVAAVIAWYTNGVPVVRHSRDQSGEGRRVDVNGQFRPAPSEEDAQADEDPDANLWVPDASEFQQGGSNRKPERPTNSRSAPGRTQGFIIAESRESIKPGLPQKGRFLIEYVHKGKYRCNIFNGKDFKWSPKDEGKHEFDFSKAVDVDKLNSWRRQNRYRITLEQIRPPSQVYSQEEKDFLYAQSEAYLQQLMKETGQPRDECLPFIVPADVKNRWVAEFNARFVGTRPGEHRRPIEPRRAGAIMTARHRYAKLQEDFKLTTEKSNSKRRPLTASTPSRGSKKAKVVTDDEQDAEGEEEEEEKATEEFHEDEKEQEDSALPARSPSPASPASKPSLPGGRLRPATPTPAHPAGPAAPPPWENAYLQLSRDGPLPDREDHLYEGLDAEGYLRSEGFRDLVQMRTVNVTRGIPDDEPLQWAAALNTAIDYFRTRRTAADLTRLRDFMHYVGYAGGQLDPAATSVYVICRELHDRWREALEKQRRDKE